MNLSYCQICRGFHDGSTTGCPPQMFNAPSRTPHKCPVCDGSGLVSRPPHVAGDIPSWSDSEIRTYPCRACDGKGVLWA